ncbi:hypothetical protein CH313_12755 [Streptomyces sp. TSRI0384-2]|uniref:Uncharacterized protein n=2 Tax=Streptomyces diastaticus group TaxID=2849069 RepID=A0A8H9HXU5_9ACTN|nr:hypothetical protein CH313_12755 [Streptomyces sp. TSRI0384-2]GFH67840.1 hypothetical protein Srut_43540 [Streptomyces rutgersensis]GFH74390.1 hypothetical protein Sdia_51580 [Streptomyces diastaticus subsp. diastaticus]GFH76663.1 hypothetical protein Sgou_13330 [Streptomyces gougerotii]GGU02661.1 hypothetical protein GCM10015534_00290 [Streptomyces diastaticus subsp. diastaticus]
MCAGFGRFWTGFPHLPDGNFAGFWGHLCNKKPLVPGGKRGERVGYVRRTDVLASADALSKYENSGAHGTDPLPVAW